MVYKEICGFLDADLHVRTTSPFLDFVELELEAFLDDDFIIVGDPGCKVISKHG